VDVQVDEILPFHSAKIRSQFRMKEAAGRLQLFHIHLIQPRYSWYSHGRGGRDEWVQRPEDPTWAAAVQRRVGHRRI
jgi:hypothetical protein